MKWLTEFRNDSGEEIPAFGCLRVTGLAVVEAGRVVATVGKPNTYGSQYHHGFNGPGTVADGAYGMMAFEEIAVAVYDDADGTPAAGELWGPRNATWKLKKNTGGWMVQGVTNSTRFLVLVKRVPFLDFRGTADAAIAADAAGTISIFYRSGATSYTDTTLSVSALNDLDDAVAISSMVRCRYEPYESGTEGWVIYQADCP